ncbi:hypothetical protein R3P38DRAFT_2838598 [Favolaschia claudopus]|uniref:Uncharacterized protein n=1 Tax=Favolaschia claudopus TaxID=2862362 RepID=A0AAW0E5Q6_9AGAR
MARPSPFDVQELLDHCIDSLAVGAKRRDFTADLLSCALVARSWTNPAQSHLFRDPHFTNSRIEYEMSGQTMFKFSRTVNGSPHLVQHVRVIWAPMNRGGETDYTRATRKMWQLEYTNLERLRLDVLIPEMYKEAIERLLRSPRLQYLRLLLHSCTLSDFQDAFERTARTLEHLDIRFACPVGSVRTPSPDFAPIPLKSLRVGMWKGFDEDYKKLGRLLDLSQLKALAIYYGPTSPPWGLMSTTTIEVLQIWAEENHYVEGLDLSLFPKLNTLRLDLLNRLPSSLLLVLSTIAPSQRIETIVIGVNGSIFENTYFKDAPRLDEALASLPLLPLPTIEVEIDRDTGIEVSPEVLFPSLVEKDMLRVLWRKALWRRDPDLNEGWWQDRIRNF